MTYCDKMKLFNQNIFSFFMKISKSIPALLICLAFYFFSTAQTQSNREHILLDSAWRFALGHSTNKDLDFDHGKGYFSYFTKTGYGDGAAAEKFDDRAWRVVNLPHDWVNELPFSEKGSRSHGYKATGENFPENN